MNPSTQDANRRSGCRWLLTGCAFVVGIAVFGLIGIVASIYVLAPVPQFDPVRIEAGSRGGGGDPSDAGCTEEAARAYRAEWASLSSDLDLIPEDAESIDEANPEAMRAVADALSTLDVAVCLEPLREADVALFYDVSDMIQRGRDGRGPQFWRSGITIFRLVRSVKPHIEHTNEVMGAIEEEYGFTFYDEDESFAPEEPAYPAP